MFFKAKKKEPENKREISPKIQTAEGWKRNMLKKMKKQPPKKN